MSEVAVAIIGAGPYGLSLAAHFAARGIEHRIFGHPMRFWEQIARAGEARYLKSFCFGTNIATPNPGFTFADYSGPRGLETFEPCSMRDFTEYGLWFQQQNVPWVEPTEVTSVSQADWDFRIELANGEQVAARHVIVATGLEGFAYIPRPLSELPAELVTHTSKVDEFAAFAGRDIAVIGGGQSALEAAALLLEAGARPQLVVRKPSILWMSRTLPERSLWQRLRSPISGLGSGPKAWLLTTFPGALRHLPAGWRTAFVKRHLPPEGAWWLRERVDGRIPIHCNTVAAAAREKNGRVSLRLKNGTCERELSVDHVIAGTGYDIDVERLALLEPTLRGHIDSLERAPRLNNRFESSVPRLHFIGAASAMSFGPLFRFVVGADYTARILASHLMNG